MVRHDGHVVSEATVWRTLREEGLIMPVQVSARTQQAERAKEGGVRERRDRAESGLAAGLFRVRDHHWRHLVTGWLSGLLVHGRASVPCFPDSDPVRCH